jgi:hypothetical protein
MNALVKQSRTARWLRQRMSEDVLEYMFELWLGPYKTMDPFEFAYAVGRAHFQEGVVLCIRRFSTQVHVLDQLLYGAASVNNVELTLMLRTKGCQDIETAINIALEHGHLDYVRTFMYLERIPRMPLSVYRWLTQS